MHSGSLSNGPEESDKFILCTSPHRIRRILINPNLPYLELLAIQLQQLFFLQIRHRSQHPPNHQEGSQEAQLSPQTVQIQGEHHVHSFGKDSHHKASNGQFSWSHQFLCFQVYYFDFISFLLSFLDCQRVLRSSLYKLNQFVFVKQPLIILKVIRIVFVYKVENSLLVLQLQVCDSLGATEATSRESCVIQVSLFFHWLRESIPIHRSVPSTGFV